MAVIIITSCSLLCAQKMVPSLLFALPSLALGAPVALGLQPMQCNNASYVLVGHFYGMEGYKKVAAESAAECCGMCASEMGKCLSWTWGHEDEKCHMKAVAPDPEQLSKCSPPCACGPAPLAPAPPPPPAPWTPPAPVPAQPSGKPTGPNILLLFPDQWRYDWDGFARPNQPDIPGPMLRVPTTRKVAAAGTRFTTAYVPAPVCASSRSC